MHWSLRLALASTFLFAPLLAPTAHAGGELALNHVWSRMADIYGEPGSVESAEFSPDGNYIVTGSKFDFTVRVFRVADGHQMWMRTVPDEIERVAWTGDGGQVVSASEDFMLRVFDAASGEVVADYKHDNGIDGLALSVDGRYMVSGQERVDGVGPARVFDTRTWEVAATLEHPGTVNEIDFSSDGKYMATVGDKSARVWNVADWSLHWERRIDEAPLLGDLRHIYINTKFSPDGSMLAVGGTHGFVYLYDAATGDLLRRFNKSGQKTETVEWTKDGRHLLVAGHGTTIDFYRTAQLLDPEIGNDALPYALRAKVSDALEYMHFNRIGTLLTTAHQDGTVQLWTFMSDDPTINARRHAEIGRQQRERAREVYREQQ